MPTWLSVTILLVLLLLAFWAMRAGWRRRERRSAAAVPVVPGAPAELGEARTEPLEATYVSSTTAGDWLDRVNAQGFIDDYAGIRISAKGRRFRIGNAIVWNLIDADGVRRGQAATFAAGGAFLGASAARAGAQTASSARAGGSSIAGAALRGMASSIGNAGWAAGSAAKEKAIASPGAYAGSLLGLANAKLDQAHKPGKATMPPPPPLNENK